MTSGIHHISRIGVLAILAIAILAAGCTSGPASRIPEEQPPDSAVPVIAKGDRLLGLGLSEGAVGFAASFGIAQDLGVQVVEMSFAWDDLEPAPGKYQNLYLDSANAFYPQNNIQVSLSINPIDTNNLRLPHDLKDKDFDDPEVIDRYNNLMDYVLSRTPDLDLVSVNIGNEIDAYLGADREKWEQYNHFYQQTGAHVRNAQPGVNVATKIMFSGITEPEAMAMNRHSDVVAITYYPLNPDLSVKDPAVVHRDFDTITSVYDNRTIYLAEAGYPSSSFLGSSQQRQSEFITEIFKAWDDHSAQVKLVNFLWLHDISGSDVDTYTQYYGFSSRGFTEFLGTLGIRTYDGKDKQALSTLKREAAARGW